MFVNPSNHTNQIETKELTLFPTKDSLAEAVSLCQSKMPIQDSQTLYALLATYHNTLIKQLEK